MSVLVPLILAVALAVSLYGHDYSNSQNYNASQSESSDDSTDDSSKDKADKDRSNHNGKSEKSRNPSAASDSRRVKSKGKPAVESPIILRDEEKVQKQLVGPRSSTENSQAGNY